MGHNLNGNNSISKTDAIFKKETICKSFYRIYLRNIQFLATQTVRRFKKIK